MESRFNKLQANLRAYLRKRGAEIDVKRKTIKVDMETLDRKATERVKELEKWGYAVNGALKNPPPAKLLECYEETGESFIDFADEIMAMYY